MTGNVRTRSYFAATRDEAIRAFDLRYGRPTLPPVVVVIAAYDEEQSLGRVLDDVPPVACGLPVGTVVVDDGSTDSTAQVAAGRPGVYVARLERNCGHGVALRTGYQLARERGAQYLVTLDADGQWDPAGLPEVLEPVVAGEADFVIGSRVLGRDETDDQVRSLGVSVFARLVSALIGQRVTDTSSGFRAMRAELTARVPQRQVQYQTSELLIRAALMGYRIAERPVTMRRRLAGTSKKGGNLLYGVRYASVILMSWWQGRRLGGLRAP